MITEVNDRTIDAAARIHAAAWRASHAAFCSAEFVALHTAARQRAYLQGEREAGKRLYLLVDGKPVGLVSVHGDLIENLYVLPAEQRRGYGARLLRFAAARCAGVPRLWVLENNAGAYALYKKHGFELTGNRHRLSDALAEAEMTRQPPREEKNVQLETERLILRPWREDDAESLYRYARNPEVGPPAGWPPHGSLAESRRVIREIFGGSECYAVCPRAEGAPVGCAELILCGRTDATERDDECELGYWLGREFWGQGLIPEAAGALLRRAFEELGMSAVWCSYYEGNAKSKRVQEKLGFTYHHSRADAPVPLLGELRTLHTNLLTRARWALGSRAVSDESIKVGGTKNERV